MCIYVTIVDILRHVALFLIVTTYPFIDIYKLKRYNEGKL